VTHPRNRKKLSGIFRPAWEPRSLKDRDAMALRDLAMLLDRGVSPHPWQKYAHDPWAVILRRYVVGDEYGRIEPEAYTNELIARTFWLRQLLYRQMQKETRRHLVQNLLPKYGIEKSDGTVENLSKKGSRSGMAARRWIAQMVRMHRCEYTRESIYASLLQWAEPDEATSELMRAVLEALHAACQAPSSDDEGAPSLSVQTSAKDDEQ
jgi:hypothetical protein